MSSSGCKIEQISRSSTCITNTLCLEKSLWYKRAEVWFRFGRAEMTKPSLQSWVDLFSLIMSLFILCLHTNVHFIISRVTAGTFRFLLSSHMENVMKYLFSLAPSLRTCTLLFNAVILLGPIEGKREPNFNHSVQCCRAEQAFPQYHSQIFSKPNQAFSCKSQSGLKHV